MLNSKKIISTILAILITAVSSVPVYATEALPKMAEMYAMKPSDSINWTYISTVVASFSIDENYGVCTGSYELYSNRKAVMTITLMKSKDGNSWSKVESWSTTNYDYSPSSFEKTSTNRLEHGYYYLTHTQVQVYDSNNKVLETGNSESPISYYA